MTDNTELFNKLLLNAVVSAQGDDGPVPVAAGKTYRFDTGDTTHHIPRAGGKAFPCPSFQVEQDKVLVRVPTNLPYVQQLGGRPIDMYEQIVEQMEAKNKLNGHDYEIFAAYKPSQEKQAGPLYDLTFDMPDNFKLLMNKDMFHSLAIQMLEKLAQPEEGRKLVPAQYARSNNDYSKRFDSPNSDLSRLVERIVKNAQVSADEVRNLKTLANGRNNFEFGRLLDTLLEGQSIGAHTQREQSRRDRPNDEPPFSPTVPS